MKIQSFKYKYKPFFVVVISLALLLLAVNQLGVTSPTDQSMITQGRGEDNPAPTALDDRGTGSQEIEVLIERIAILQSPIKGAGVSSRDSHLPGAPRAYRNGTHQGLDYYSGTCGVSINTGTPVFAAGPGMITRIDHDFEEMTAAEHQELLQICRDKGYTPEYVLDKLRGRQVWIDHGSGLVTRYAHLEDVSPNLQVGNLVMRGTQIGTVGNSGTTASVQNRSDGPHLHFEIWIDGSYLGEGLNTSQVRQILESIHQQTSK